MSYLPKDLRNGNNGTGKRKITLAPKQQTEMDEYNDLEYAIHLSKLEAAKQSEERKKKSDKESPRSHLMNSVQPSAQQRSGQTSNPALSSQPRQNNYGLAPNFTQYNTQLNHVNQAAANGNNPFSGNNNGFSELNFSQESTSSEGSETSVNSNASSQGSQDSQDSQESSISQASNESPSFHPNASALTPEDDFSAALITAYQAELQENSMEDEPVLGSPTSLTRQVSAVNSNTVRQASSYLTSQCVREMDQSDDKQKKETLSRSRSGSKNAALAKQPSTNHFMSLNLPTGDARPAANPGVYFSASYTQSLKPNFIQTIVQEINSIKSQANDINHQLEQLQAAFASEASTYEYMTHFKVKAADATLQERLSVFNKYKELLDQNNLIATFDLDSNRVNFKTKNSEPMTERQTLLAQEYFQVTTQYLKAQANFRSLFDAIEERRQKMSEIKIQQEHLNSQRQILSEKHAFLLMKQKEAIAEANANASANGYHFNSFNANLGNNSLGYNNSQTNTMNPSYSPQKRVR